MTTGQNRQLHQRTESRIRSEASGQPKISTRIRKSDRIRWEKSCKAWMPFAILSSRRTGLGFAAGQTCAEPGHDSAFKVVQADGTVRPGPPGWDVPYLHNAVYRAAPVVVKPTPEAARYDFNWLSATGTGCFLAAILSGLLLGMSPVRLAKVFWHTLRACAWRWSPSRSCWGWDT